LVFFASFSRSSHFRQKFQNAKIFANFRKINSKKNKKNFATKQNKKWLLNSRWLPKLNLLVKTTTRLFFKKNSTKQNHIMEKNPCVGFG
jgi:hypothetical protein